MKKSDKNGKALIPLPFLPTGQKAEIVEMRGFRHRPDRWECLDEPEPGLRFRPGHKPYRRAHRGHTDRGHRWIHRLNCLGLVPGEIITILKNDVSAPLILAVKDSRLCIGRGVASKVMVRPVDSRDDSLDEKGQISPGGTDRTEEQGMD